MKVIVFDYPKKRFEKVHGKYTKGVAQLYEKGLKEFEVHIKRGMGKNQRKRIVTHEMGHLLSERCKIAKKVSSKEKKTLVKYYEHFYAGKHRKKMKMTRADKIEEAIADIYVRKKHGLPSERKLIKRNLPKTNHQINRCFKMQKPKISNVKL